ncbi:MAG: mandelate racemase/muconate lactonizing enzyme family protein [Eubacteriales bacterium]
MTQSDEGVTGIGEATSWPGSPVIEVATRFFGQQIIGEDPMRVDYIWTKLYRDYSWIGPTGASLCAISGIDMALNDLKAKSLGIPLYQMMGGAYRTRLRTYANYWFTDLPHTPEAYAKRAGEIVARGFRGVKYDPFSHTNYSFGDFHMTSELSKEGKDRAVEIVKQVREAIGPDSDMMIETHALLDFKTSVEMTERLKPYGVTWYEEPVGPENVDSLNNVRKRIDPMIPICVGERHYTRYGIREVLEKGICDVIMPDITRCGGPTEMKKMADMAQTYNVVIAPHNPNGPLSTLASAHVMAATPNFFRLEFFAVDVPWRDKILTHPIDWDNGDICLSERPGLGCDLVEEELEKHPGIVDKSKIEEGRVFYI